MHVLHVLAVDPDNPGLMGVYLKIQYNKSDVVFRFVFGFTGLKKNQPM